MIRIGFVGAGGMARFHGSSLKGFPEVKVVGAADPSPSARKEFLKLFPEVNIFSSWEELLDVDMDAVFICSPTPYHARQVIEFSRRGVHVFCEKPLTTVPEEAEEVARSVEKSRVKFMIGFCRRFDHHWGKVRELILENKIGRPVIWREIEALRGLWGWYVRKGEGWGPLVDKASHTYDFACWIFGKPRRVFAHITGRLGEDSADTGFSWIEFVSGDEVIYTCSWMLPPKVLNINFDIVGTQGLVRVNPSLPDSLKKKGLGGVILCREDGEEWVTFSPNNMHLEEVKYFLECLEKDEDPSPGVEEALLSTRIISALIESASSGKVVDI